jgi:adenylate cyclase
LWSYNLTAYPLCLVILLVLLQPLVRCLSDLRGGRLTLADRPRLQASRRRLLNLPLLAIGLNLLSWLPGAIVFPLVICLLGGWSNAIAIWQHFAVSFVVAALLTTAQAFFLLEGFLMAVLYPEFFADARPAEVPGVVRIGQELRQWLYWVAVALAPMVAVLAVTLNFTDDQSSNFPVLRVLALGTAVVCLMASGVIAWVVGRDLLVWLRTHEYATEQIARGRDDYRIDVKRPDEFGRLSDGFNDMAAALGRARHLRETFGQFVRPDVRDEILNRYPGLGGEVQEVTVLFLDIRGFTRRSSGESPEMVVDLLNHFFSLAVAAVEQRGGWVNKFLGDGILALFGIPVPQPDHADRAVWAALDLLASLHDWNEELLKRGQPPVVVGGGIHTGPALVGCVGATLTARDGRVRVQRELTAVGETINVGQRIEQLTKRLDAAVLLSEQTHKRLQTLFPLTSLGPQPLPGYDEPVVVYRLVGPAETTAVAIVG